MTKSFFIKTNYGIYYYKDQYFTIRHREDGPAIEYTDGTKYWYANGIYHRADGPAITYPNGDKQWFINGNRHREDGPSIEYTNGYKKWFLNNKEYSEKEYEVLTKRKNLINFL